ncbi:hypothetical protein AMAG_05338 [Allomyces macrogynus ATCC 38327]|uniref:Tyrosine specific protein phosphatases domain-containing protein n=1 Tax=Allomyces macrogynus (strain ATCC 38327) TaxID=578462 RepID=A0A0L0SBU4_ALLM3|nr:hypothetical protein AMAG_05338 [Allomyces macrogynus ATCC 38327]|eukprot:KNE59889.1 hypothetical protein AMAG_05338 [Allomyces macrogynus ATCC 38327]
MATPLTPGRPVTAVRTSVTHPIQVSWVFPKHVLSAPPPDPLALHAILAAAHPFTKIGTTAPRSLVDLLDQVDTDVLGSSPQVVLPPVHGNLAIASCPGKQDVGLARDLEVDMTRMAMMGIRALVCCLYDDELDHLGVPWSRYSAMASKLNLDVIRTPMVDGCAPAHGRDLEPALEAMHQHLTSGNHVLVHCRAGIGRASLITCAYLMRYGWSANDDRAIQTVRRRRSPRAVETDVQEEFLLEYYIYMRDRAARAAAAAPAPVVIAPPASDMTSNCSLASSSLDSATVVAAVPPSVLTGTKKAPGDLFTAPVIADPLKPVHVGVVGLSAEAASVIVAPALPTPWLAVRLNGTMAIPRRASAATASELMMPGGGVGGTRVAVAAPVMGSGKRMSVDASVPGPSSPSPTPVVAAPVMGRRPSLLDPGAMGFLAVGMGAGVQAMASRSLPRATRSTMM